MCDSTVRITASLVLAKGNFNYNITCKTCVKPIDIFKKMRLHGCRPVKLSMLMLGPLSFRTGPHSNGRGWPGACAFFSLAWKCLSCKNDIVHALQPCSSLLCRLLVTVIFETTIPNLAKSFTSLVAGVLGSSHTFLTSFPSRVFEIFRFTLCQACPVLRGSLSLSNFNKDYQREVNNCVLIYIKGFPQHSNLNRYGMFAP